jgi:hypothetical protein
MHEGCIKREYTGGGDRLVFLKTGIILPVSGTTSEFITGKTGDPPSEWVPLHNFNLAAPKENEKYYFLL